ncbi:MAG: hypothetical protein H7A21_17700 [Spirochaetales bacterium]|nr:hypothetical protein [Leptospiraceae bacterium]MCP5483275.1 hypothetical protein [Spirochaetales bacterium]
MNALYKLFDRFTEMVPPQILQFIRLGALLIWLIIATIVAYMAWQSGAQSAPQMGQELSLATIREKVEREENLRRTGNVILPDLNDLVPERRRERSGAFDPESPPRIGLDNPGLAGEDIEMLEPESPPRSRGTDELPPYVGDDARLSPPRYAPERDQGVGGVRQPRDRASGTEAPAIPLDSAPRPAQPESRTQSPSGAPTASDDLELVP